MKDTIYRQDAIDALMEILDRPNHAEFLYGDEIYRVLTQMPSAQPEQYIDSIVSEIEKTISETRENGKRHDINIRANGDLICYGLQLALEIIEEKRNERFDRKTSGD